MAHFSNIHLPGSLEGDGMQCPLCQSENSSRAKFCLECGARIACYTALAVQAVIRLYSEAVRWSG